MDFTYLPMSKAGHDWAIVFVDRLSKFIKVVPSKSSVTAPEVAKILFDHIVRMGFGVPRSIVSDRDARFTGKFWGALQERLGTKLLMSSAYHPETDGQTERANRTFKEMLRSYVSEKGEDWDVWVSMLEFGYNNSVHPGTGQTPFFLNHGQHPHMPWCLNPEERAPSASNNESADGFARRIHKVIKLTQESLGKQQKIMARAADVHRRHHTFKVGDKVLLSSEHISTGKLVPRYLGPFVVTACVSTVAMRLALPPSMQGRHPVFHVSRLRPYIEDIDFPRGVSVPVPENTPAATPRVVPETGTGVGGQTTWTVERIEGVKTITNRRGTREKQYKIKWLGHDDFDSSWEPYNTLKTDIPEMLKEYEESRRND